MAEIEVRPDIEFKPQFDTEVKLPEPQISTEVNTPELPNINYDAVNDIVTTEAGRVKKQEQGQPYLDVQPELQQAMISQPEDYHEIVPGIVGTGTHSYTHINEDGSTELRPMSMYEPENAESINRNIHNPVHKEDTDLSHVEGQDKLSSNIQTDQKVATENDLVKLNEERTAQDKLEEDLQKRNVSSVGSVNDEFKTWGVVAPGELLAELQPEPLKVKEDKTNLGALKKAIDINVFNNTKQTLKNEGLDDNQAHVEASLLAKPKTGKTANLEKEFGISNKANDIRSSVLDIVADDKSTAFPKQIRDLARKYKDEVLAGDGSDYIPSVVGLANRNTVYSRGNHLIKLLKAAERGDIKTADKILHQLAQKTVRTANEVIDEAVRQGALYKTKKSDYVHFDYEKFMASKQTGKTVEQAIKEQIEEAGFTPANIVKPNKEKQKVDGLPVVFNQTDFYAPTPYMAKKIKAQRLEGYNESATIADKLAPVKKELAPLLTRAVKSLNGLYADLPITAKKLDVKPIIHDMHDMGHNIHTGNQSTAEISNILYNRNARFNGSVDPEDDIYRNEKFRKLPDYVKDGSLNRGQSKSSYLKNILMPALSTPAKVAQVKELADKYNLNNVDKDYVNKHIDAMAATNLWHKNFDKDLDLLLRPKDALYTKDGKPIKDTSVVVHHQIRLYDNEMNELKSAIIVNGINKYGSERLKGLLEKFLKIRSPLVYTLARFNDQLPRDMEAVKRAIADDPDLMADIHRLNKLTAKKSPATKSTARLGINGTNTNHVIDISDAIAGNADMTNLKYQYACADTFSRLIDADPTQDKSFGVSKNSLKATIENLAKMRKKHPELAAEINAAVTGALEHSEFARVNKIYSPESYSGITMSGVRSGAEMARLHNVVLPPDIRLPEGILKLFGLLGKNNLAIKDVTGVETPVSVTLLNKDNMHVIKNFKNPKFKGLDSTVWNSSLLGVPSRQLSLYHIGGPLNELTGRNDIYGVSTSDYLANLAEQFGLLDKPLYEKFLNKIDRDRLPIGMFQKGVLRSPEHLENWYKLLQGQYKPDDIPEKVARIYPAISLIPDDETDYADNAYHQPLAIISKMNDKGIPVPLLKVDNNNMSFNFQKEINDITSLIDKEAIKSDSNNILRGALVYQHLKNTDPNKVTDDVLTNTFTEVAPTVNGLENAEIKIKNDLNNLEKDNIKKAKSGEPALNKAALEAKAEQAYASNMEEARAYFSKSPTLTALVKDLGVEDEDHLHNLGFIDPSFMIGENTNKPFDIVDRLSKAGVEKFVPYTWGYQTTVYKGKDKVKIGSSVRGLLTIGANLKPDEIGIGYHLAKEVFKKPLKDYMRSLTDDTKRQALRDAIKSEDFSPGLFVLLKNFSKEIPVGAFRLPKLFSTPDQTFRAQIYAPDFDENGKYLKNKNETEHFAISIELAHQWNGDTDGDMLNAMPHSYNRNNMQRFAPTKLDITKTPKIASVGAANDNDNVSPANDNDNVSPANDNDNVSPAKDNVSPAILKEPKIAGTPESEYHKIPLKQGDMLNINNLPRDTVLVNPVNTEGVMGAGLGGLPKETALNIMHEYLDPLTNKVNIAFIDNERTPVYKATLPNYEVSSKGDKDGSALYARFSKNSKPLILDNGQVIDLAGKSIEDVFQKDIKQSGKGRPPSSGSILFGKTLADTKKYYKLLWTTYLQERPDLVSKFREIGKTHNFTDQFATPGGTSQAEVLNELFNKPASITAEPKSAYSGVEKVISGGQEGGDELGLEVAKQLGIRTGGTTPPGHYRRDGRGAMVANYYGLTEIAPETQKAMGGDGKRFYVPRTILNAQNSDATVYYSVDPNKSRGIHPTKRGADEAGKPFILNPSAEQLQRFLIQNKVKVLNVAGSAAKDNFDEDFARRSLTGGLKGSRNASASTNVNPDAFAFYPTYQSTRNLMSLADKFMNDDSGNVELKQKIKDYIARNAGVIDKTILKQPLGDRLGYMLDTVLGAKVFFENYLPKFLKRGDGSKLEWNAKSVRPNGEFKPSLIKAKEFEKGNPNYRYADTLIAHALGNTSARTASYEEALSALGMTPEAFTKYVNDVKEYVKNTPADLGDFNTRSLKRKHDEALFRNTLRNGLYGVVDKQAPNETDMAAVHTPFSWFRHDKSYKWMNLDEPLTATHSYDKLKQIALNYIHSRGTGNTLRVPNDPYMIAVLGHMISGAGYPVKFQLFDGGPMQNIRIEDRQLYDAKRKLGDIVAKKFAKNQYSSTSEDGEDDEHGRDNELMQLLNSIHTLARINRRVNVSDVPGVLHLHSGSYGTQAKNIMDAFWGNLKLNVPSKKHIPGSKANQGVAYTRMTEI